MAKQVEAIKTLGIKHDSVTCASHLFPQLMAITETFCMQREEAYVDDTLQEEVEKRGSSKNNPWMELNQNTGIIV